MAATTIVQARIDPAIRDRAADALANEGALTTGLTSDPAAHDARPERRTRIVSERTE